MFDHSDETIASDVNHDPKDTGAHSDAVNAGSFKQKRQARRRGRLSRSLDQRLVLKTHRRVMSRSEKPSAGPTQQTTAKLIQDPLLRFRKQNILTDQQIWAFQRIRRAVQLITDGTQVRLSRFTDVAVQTSRRVGQAESDYEIRLKEYYTLWIDRMTRWRLPAGPVLDIIIDELSLSATDRKWGRRKGWAKDHLQASLDLYGNVSPLCDRNR